MTGLDIVVLVIVGLAMAGGLLRGFVQEVLALAAWIAAVAAIYCFHTPLAERLYQFIGTPETAGVLAFALLLLVPYLVMKAIARWAGTKSRGSVLGWIDRVLGAGFGALKGLVLVVLAFSILALGYDSIWGAHGRPDWITQARSYPLISAASDELVQVIQERHDELSEQAEIVESEE